MAPKRKAKDSRTLLAATIPAENTVCKVVDHAVKTYCEAHADVAVRFQQEKGKEAKDSKDDGYLHYQFAVYFRKHADRYRSDTDVAQAQGILTQITGVDCSRVHISWPDTKEHQHNTWQYCNKPETRTLGPYEYNAQIIPGHFTDLSSASQGARTDLKKFKSDCLIKCAEEIEAAYPEIEARYHKFFAKYAPPLKRSFAKPKVVIISAPTGVGKTFGCQSYHPDERVYHAQLDWRNLRAMQYSGEKIVIIDDLHPGTITECGADWLLALLDRYPIHVNTFAAKAPWMATHIYINTTVELVSSLFPYSHTAEIMRRVDRVIRYDELTKTFTAEPQREPAVVPDVSSLHVLLRDTKQVS